jgi:hypothetical protein
MLIQSKFEFFQLVYLKTDSDQRQRMVTRLSVTPNGTTYELSCGTQTSWHFAEEISEEKDILIQTTQA